MGESPPPRVSDDAFRPRLFVDGVRFVAENGSFVADKTAEHLVLSGAAIGVALLLALPLGVVLGHLHRGSFVAINVGNVGRALPSLALIALGLPLFGIGFTNVLVALVVLAVPPVLTNTYVAVASVDADAVDAARGMGMSPAQILRRVELPLALPLLFAGVRTASVYVVATATIAAIGGGGGLGEIIVDQASYRLHGVIGASLCVVALAFLVDLVLASLQRLATPDALRGRGPEAGVRAGRCPVATAAPG